MRLDLGRGGESSQEALTVGEIPATTFKVSVDILMRNSAWGVPSDLLLTGCR
jgi:hypothetical protein